jgi:tungstate transport system substrate-binding protein
MRKRFGLFLSLLVLMAFVVGCGATQPVKPAEPAPAPAAQPAPPPAPPKPANPNLILATTTSTADTGLLDVLLPMFQAKTGYLVKPIAVGTGQALAMGEKGDADVLLVHAPADELKLVAKGAATGRVLVMHNDFIVVGPAEDPAKVKGLKSSKEAFQKIAAAKATFVTRGDDSGTNKKELAIWKDAGVKPEGAWYMNIGAGMGQALNVSSEKGGYTLTDRGTFLSMQKTLHVAIIVEGEPSLLNIYHVMQVNPAQFPKVNAEGAKAFSDFLLAKETQDFIGKFGVDKYGSPLFFPDGGKTDEQLMK